MKKRFAVAATSAVSACNQQGVHKQAKVYPPRGIIGAVFDHQYLSDQRSGHQETLTKVNAYLAPAPVGSLIDHASEIARVVQKHLNLLEKIK